MKFTFKFKNALIVSNIFELIQIVISEHFKNAIFLISLKLHILHAYIHKYIHLHMHTNRGKNKLK